MIRGGIYYEDIPSEKVVGIQGSQRPVVVVSPHPWGGAVQVVPLTAQKHYINDEHEHHVTVSVGKRLSVALCEQIRTVSTKYLRKYPMAVCSLDTMQRIDAQVARVVGLAV